VLLNDASRSKVRRSGQILQNSRPYAPGWLDQLIDLICTLPGPIWLYYLVVYAVGTVLVNCGRWASGQLPLGSWDFVPHTAVVWVSFLLPMVDYLDQTATASLADFRPALQIDDAEYAKLTYALTNAPRLPVFFASAIWFTVAAVAFWIGYPTLHPLFATWEIAAVAFTFLMGGAAGYHTVHQLRMVSNLYARVQSVDLFRLEPLYAFSRLTARTAACWLVISFGSLLLLPTQLSLKIFSLDFSFGIFILVYALYTLVVLSAFVLPLLGIHRLIAAEKERQQLEANHRLDLVIHKIYLGVDADNLDGADAVNKTLNSLITARDLLEKIPAWPWQPGTLRGIATTILLPLVLWLVQQLLSRYLEP
jgi:hypothetical protein